MVEMKSGAFHYSSHTTDDILLNLADLCKDEAHEWDSQKMMCARPKRHVQVTCSP